MNAETFSDAVAKGVSSGDWSDLQAWISDECSYCFNSEDCHEEDPFDDRIFDLFIGILARDDFRNSVDSYNVLRIVECDWGRFSENQKSVPLTALEAAYPAFKDPMSWFMTAEILGEFFCDRRGLDALLRLKPIEDDGQRSMIAFGLGYLARECLDKGIATLAAEHLESMADDPSPEVRDEVREAKIERPPL